MKTLFLCGREAGYTRNQVLFRALQTFGPVENLTDDIAHRSILTRSLLTSLRAFPYWITGKYDLAFVGFYGHLLMLPAGLLKRRPVLFDAFLSTYDTLIDDRKKMKAGSLGARAAFGLDRLACSRADHVLLDTPLQVEYFVRTFGISREKISAIPVGCNETVFTPRPLPSEQKFVRVLFYSTYLPLHGAEIVVQAAARCAGQAVKFRMIGNGLEYARVRQLASDLKLENIEFVAPVPLGQLAQEIAQADICLGGHFGVSEKAGRVVPGKVYQMLASQRPVIAANSPANLAFLEHGKTAWLCPQGDPAALAEAIQTLGQSFSLRQSLAEQGYRLFAACCSERAITGQVQSILERLGVLTPGG